VWIVIWFTVIVEKSVLIVLLGAGWESGVNHQMYQKKAPKEQSRQDVNIINSAEDFGIYDRRTNFLL
jgi:hypothetical protein